MDSHRATPVSVSESPHSREGSHYGTPSDSLVLAQPNAKPNDKDPQLVVGAGRSIKNMLVDLMRVLQDQADAKIFIQGNISLRVHGRDSYTIRLHNEDNVEPTNLQVRIDKASQTPHAIPSGDSNGVAQKRKAEEMARADPTSAQAPPSPKRARTYKEFDMPGTERDAKTDDEEEDRILSKLNDISSQIKWVEDCRRIADGSHDMREEKWRSTSATFHDEGRRARERHEAWIVSELGWQRSTLVQLANDMKGLYPLTHSLKWETPPHLSGAPSALPVSLPASTRPSQGTAGPPGPHMTDKPLGKVYTPRTGRGPGRPPNTTKTNGPPMPIEPK